MKTRRRGQVFIEALLIGPVLILIFTGTATLLAMAGIKHLLWVDAITLHRSRNYQQTARECPPHSLWKLLPIEADAECSKGHSESSFQWAAHSKLQWRIER